MKYAILSCILSFLILCFGCVKDDCDYEKRWNNYKYLSLDTIYISSNGRDFIVINNPYKHIGALRLKGAMHNHSLNSPDGSRPPEEVATIYRDVGKFHFYAITDHNYITPDPGVEGIVWMGESLEDTKHGDDNQHLCIYNLPANFKDYYKDDYINALITKYTSVGAYVSYAHPDYSNQVQSSQKISSVNRVQFVEVLNPGYGGSERAYNILLSKFGAGVYCFGVDDYHQDGQFHKSYIIAFADKAEKDNIWNTLLHGSFYASKGGGMMNISCENGQINIYTHKGSDITFIGKNRDQPEAGFVLYSVNNAERATYKITGKEGYVYVKVQNRERIAISQAIVIME